MRGTSNLSENVCHLFGDAAGQRRTALLQKRRHSRDGAGFQSHICIQKDQNGVRGKPGEHIASVLFSTQPGEEAGRLSMRTRRSELAIARTMRWSWGLGSCDSAGRCRAASEGD